MQCCARYQLIDSNLFIVLCFIHILTMVILFGVTKKEILQKKALRLKNFKPGNFHTSPLILGLNFFKTLTRSWQNNSKKLRIDK